MFFKRGTGIVQLEVRLEEVQAIALKLRGKLLAAKSEKKNIFKNSTQKINPGLWQKLTQSENKKKVIKTELFHPWIIL
ncbi:MAG: hypothetical protein KKD86_20315 [Bacteroidetes bacterium]|nr:hypothetical protein [Bacteroidota bacterium]